MNPRAACRVRALVFIAVIGFLSTACSVVSVDQKIRYRDAEGYFEPQLLEQIKPGETSHTWVLQHFGRPWLREADGLAGYPAEVRVDTWRFEREQQKNTRVLLLFRSRTLNQQYEYLHVVTEGGTVMRAWRDKLATVDVHRLMAAMGYDRIPVSEPSATLQPRTDATELTESVPPPAALVVEDVADESQPAETTAAPSSPRTKDSANDPVPAGNSL